MDLWIRSQDKRRLTKVLELEMTSSSYYGSIDMPYSVLNQDEVWLGSYKTEERALEVLGEIDERIMLLNTFSIAKDRDTLLALKNALPEEKLQGLAYPYEMPKE